MTLFTHVFFFLFTAVALGSTIATNDGSSPSSGSTTGRGIAARSVETSFGPSFNNTGLDLHLHCHVINDRIGKTCQFFSEESWTFVTDIVCADMPAQMPILTGQTGLVWIKNAPDGSGKKGHRQNFWGQFNVDRNGPISVSKEECQKVYRELYTRCEGFGGWTKQPWGTIFGECIRQCGDKTNNYKNC